MSINDFKASNYKVVNEKIKARKMNELKDSMNQQNLQRNVTPENQVSIQKMPTKPLKNVYDFH